MALFWSKKPKAEKIYDKAAQPVRKTAAVKAVKPAKPSKIVKSAKETKVVTPAPLLGSDSDTSAASVIIRPHVTEKSGLLSQSNVYTFLIRENANKQTVWKAVNTLYKVMPTKISIINLPSKNVFVRGRKGVVSGTRKAMVTLKQGEKIDFV